MFFAFVTLKNRDRSVCTDKNHTIRYKNINSLTNYLLKREKIILLNYNDV